MKNNFYNADGSLTRYGLACGYVEKFGEAERYVVLEQISSNGALLVRQGGRDHRLTLYSGRLLGKARDVFQCEVRAIRRDNKETEI